MNIVITGASRGIGLETLKAFCGQSGHQIFVLTRDIQKVELELKLLESKYADVSVIRCDVSDEVSVLRAAKNISDLVPSIEILVNNSGRLAKGNFEDITLSDWKDVYNVNVFGAVSVTKSLMHLLRNGKLNSEKRICAHVVNISSMGGVQGSLKYSGLSAYSSSKGALITFTECLAEEFKLLGIIVNAVALGSVQTEMFMAAFPGIKASADPDKTGAWISEFAQRGYMFFNGKTLQLSTGTP